MAGAGAVGPAHELAPRHADRRLRGHGPHFCLGASLARVATEVALTMLLDRFPAMSVVEATRAPDPGTWRLSTLRVALS